MVDVSGDGNKNIQINVNPSFPTLASIHVDPSNPSIALDTNPVYGPKGDKGDKGDKGNTGEQGIQGEQGEAGEDGFSPVANVVKLGTKATITITDKDGTTTAEVFDGEGAISDVKVNGTSVVEDKIANIDLTGKQNITDNTLTTTSKTIVGAINEVNAKPSMPSLDEVTITTNTDDELQTVAVIDQKTGNANKQWTGTLAEYTAITTKDSNTIYNITDDEVGGYDIYTKTEVQTYVSDAMSTMLSALYPIGSIYISTSTTNPMETLISDSEWELVAEDRVLQGAGSRGNVGTTINESLPNITGHLVEVNPYIGQNYSNNAAYDGALSTYFADGATDGQYASGIGSSQNGIDFDASRSSSTYQDNAPVQQDAYLVNIWERTA